MNELSSFLEAQEDCIAGSWQKYMQWLNSIDLDSMSLLVLAVSDPKTFQTIQDGDGNSRLRKCLVDEFKEAVLNFQAPHLPHHESVCKERVAELRDEILFKQPESSHMGDCPIFFLPLSIDPEQSPLYACCSTTICNGCSYANFEREAGEKLRHKCLFCRSPLPTTQEESNKNKMKRAEANDPNAMTHMGYKLYDEGDYERAFEYWTKAAELGDASAHHELSLLYHNGEGVEKDEKKELYHLEKAAIGGHPRARCNLALKEGRNKRYDRSAKHFIIAANLGHDDSIQMLKEYYKHGLVSKEDFAAALRAHQAAVEATKSPQRELASKTGITIQQGSNDPLASIINHSYSTKRSPTVMERPARRRQRDDNNSHIDFASNDRLEKTEDVAGSTAWVDPSGMDPAEAAEYPKKVTLTMLDRNGDPSDKLVVYIKQKERDPTAKTTSEEL
eukprot:scaffold1634_cov118-Skeletonema_dohrnii-CCMP3373.AAC.7